MITLINILSFFFIIIPICILIYSIYIKKMDLKKLIKKIKSINSLKIFEICWIFLTIGILLIYTKETFLLRKWSEIQHITSIRPTLFPISYNKNKQEVTIKNFSNSIAKDINSIIYIQKDNWWIIWLNSYILALSPLSNNNLSIHNTDIKPLINIKSTIDDKNFLKW